MSVASIAGAPRVRPIVQLGVGDARTHEIAALWDQDLWDAADALWSGLEPYWVDCTCNVHEISDLFVGRERSVETWEIGTATLLLDNRSGWADYPRLGHEEIYLPVRPGVQIRIGVALDGALDESALWKFRGFIDEANPLLDPLLGETVELRCIDAKGESGRGELAKVEPAVGAGEMVHQRIGRILTAQAWPSEWRNLEVAGVRLVATEMGQGVIDAINRASDSGGGSVFGDLDGKVAYRNYGWQAFPAAELPAYTIGNVEGPTYAPLTPVEDPAGSGLYLPPSDAIEAPPGFLRLSQRLSEQPAGSGLWVIYEITAPGDVCPTAWELSFARADFSNRVLLSRADMDAPIVAEDPADIATFGAEPFALSDLQTESTTELSNLAARILRARNFALAPRVGAVSLDAATGGGQAIDLMARADPRDPTLVLCRHKGEDGRMVINRQCLVTGMRHRITPSGWEARLQLDDASPWRIGAGVGQWDVDDWDAADWAPTPAPI